MKHKLFAVILSLLTTLSFSQLNHDSNDHSYNFKKELPTIFTRKAEFDTFFTELYDIIEVKDELNNLSNDLETLKKSIEINDNRESQYLFQQVKLSLSRIELVYSALNGLKMNQEFLSEDYFDLWNQVFQRKIDVDKLFMKVNVHSSGYAGQNETEFVEIRKKGIYNPSSKLYEHYLLMIRNTNQCDYTKRIEILLEVEKLLAKMESLAKTKNTREDEKYLKKLTDINDIKEYFNSAK